MKEHDTVRLKETYLDIPAGAVGTIVHIYGCKDIVEVEFDVGDCIRVQTININLLEKI